MQIAEYYTIRRGLRNSAPAPDGAVVTAMETELRAALLTSDVFHSVEVGRTDDADRYLIAMCGFAPETDPSEAAAALARLWSKQIAYGFWEASTVRVDKRQVELQGATRLSLRGHFVTVHLLAQQLPAPARPVELPPRVRQVPSTGIAHGALPAAVGDGSRRRRTFVPRW
jgi:hypothetical protein